VSAYNLLQNPDIVKAIDDDLKKKEEVIRKAQHEEIEKQARGQIVSQTQIEAVLSSIAMGTFKRKKMIAAIDVKSKKVITGEIEEVPTETDMISAAEGQKKKRKCSARRPLRYGTNMSLTGIISPAITCM
jgi:mannitol-specific phosphotransferase system IIBC component